MGVGAKYLIVEDDETVARSVARYLRRTGHVHISGTLAEARSTLERDKLWTGFVLDVGLPDGSGLSILEWLRSLGLRTPVLVLTASRDDEVLRAAGAHGATYLPKPFQFDELDGFVRVSECTNDASDALERVIERLGEVCRLSPREREIVLLAAAGMARSAIAERLNISSATIGTLGQRAVLKSGCGSWKELMDDVHTQVFGIARRHR